MPKLYILFALLFSFNAFTQDKYTISGHIKDEKNGESIIGARVYNDSLQLGVVSNINGFYSITLPSGKYHFLFSSTGYKPSKNEH